MISVIVAMASALFTAQAAETMYVNTTSGTRELALDNVKTVEFASTGGLVVSHLEGANTVIEAADFQSITFNKASGIGAVASDSAAALRFDGLTLTADGSISLYDPQGRLVARSGSGSLSTAGLAPGIYVAKTSTDATLKLIKR